MQNLTKIFILLMCFCAISKVLKAEDFYCVTDNKVSEYRRSVNEAPNHCTKVSENLTSDSRLLTQTVPIKFIKLVNGVLTEMTQQEKDTVLADEATANAVLQQSRINNMQVTAPQAIRAAIAVLQGKGITITEQEVIDALNNQN